MSASLPQYSSTYEVENIHKDKYSQTHALAASFAWGVSKGTLLLVKESIIK